MDFENVKTKKDLEDYILYLKKDFKNNFDEWENGTLPNFLERAMACLYANGDRDSDLNNLYSKLNNVELNYAATLLLVASFKKTMEYIKGNIAADPVPDASGSKGVCISEYVDRKLEELQDAGLELEDSIVIFLDKLASELSNPACYSYYHIRFNSYIWFFLAKVLMMGKFYE